MPHLMVNNSASVLVTNEAWWTVLVRELFVKWMCDIDVAISFLILASVTTRAVWGKEETWRIISSSSWVQILSFIFFFLLTKLKEKWSEKLSIIWWPGENLILRGEKDGKIPWDLLYELMRWPLVRLLWRLVNKPILCGFGMVDNGGKSSMRFLKIWLIGSLKGWICDLLAIFCRWNFIGIILAMALIPSEGEVLKAPKIQMVALLYILLRIFIW